VAILEELGEWQVLPVEVDRPTDRAVGIDDARRADTDAEDRGGGLTPDVVDELMDELDGLLTVAAIELAGAFRGELAAQVGEGRGESALAEVERDDAPRIVLERNECRLLTARAGAAADVLGEAIPRQVRDQLANAGAGEAGQPGDVGAADGTQVVQGAQDECRVVGAGLRMGGLKWDSVRATRSRTSPPTSSRELTKRMVDALAYFVKI
jgi:hypothetical protein